MRLFALVAILCLFGSSPADDSPKKKNLGSKLEVEIEKKGDTARITVYINNDSDTDLSFETGSHGGGGSLDDRVKLVGGTAPTVLPEVTFEKGDRNVTLRPPAFSGPTRRTMKAEKFTVPAKKRVAYASWAVPVELIGDRMTYAKLKTPLDNEWYTYDSKVIDKTEKK